MDLVVSIEMEISGRSFAIWYYVEPGGLCWSNVLNLAFPLQRLRPDTQPEHQDPVSHTAQKIREKKKVKERKKERERGREGVSKGGRKEGRKEGREKERKKERK